MTQLRTGHELDTWRGSCGLAAAVVRRRPTVRFTPTEQPGESRHPEIFTQIECRFRSLNICTLRFCRRQGRSCLA